MSESNAIVCVTILVDSSLLLSSEWADLLPKYVLPLFGRLHEAYKHRPFRMACVCYAASSTRPKPLLSQTYFVTATELTRELAAKPEKFGVGTTGTGSRGMAVLEGIVAAIELFDAFRESIPPNVTAHSHIIHIAACSPDSAERPLWNVSPALDSATWETLPSELRKRNINYSLIALRPSQKLIDFHTSVSSGAVQQAWFETKPSHIVRLMGYSSPPKNVQLFIQPSTHTPQGTKRTIDPGPSPENKRPRVAKPASPGLKNSPTVSATQVESLPRVEPPTHATPPAIHATTTTSIDKSVPSMPLAPSLEKEKDTMSQPSTQVETPATIPPLDRSGLQVAMAKVREVDGTLKQKEELALAAERAGNHEEAKHLREQQEAARVKVDMLKRIIYNSIKGSASHPVKPEETVLSSPPKAQPGPGSSLSPFKPVHTLPSINAPEAGPSHVRTPSQGQQLQPQAPMLPSGTPPQLASQMQKLMEQRNRTPRMPLATVSVPEQPLASNIQAVPMSIPNGWRGFLSWRGVDSGTNQKREMQTFVQLMFQQRKPNNDIMTDSWPTSISITPSTPIAPWAGLVEWIKSHDAAIFQLNLAPSGDPKMNEDNLKMLLRLLTDRGIYALAAWQGPDGLVKNRLLFFMAKNSLCGAYFQDGVPELPKPQHPPQSIPQLSTKLQQDLYNKMNDQQRSSLNSLSPDKRAMAMNAFAHQLALLRQKHQHQQQQQQQHQQPQQQQSPQQHPGFMSSVTSGQPIGQHAGMNIANQFAGRPPAMFPTGQPVQPGHMQGAPGMMSFSPPHPAMGGMPLGMQNRAPSGGGNPMANVDPVVLQSFMQRNPNPSNSRI